MEYPELPDSDDLPEFKDPGTEIKRRFWKYVDRRGPNGCWLWKKAKNKPGYGMFRVGERSILAHRVAYGFTFGVLPEACCHSCDTPACVNPAHLVGGTRAWNNADKVAKNRQRNGPLPGEKHPLARLTDETVRRIRARYAEGGITQKQLGDEYGVTRMNICRIVNRKGWRHVPDAGPSESEDDHP